VALPFWKQSPTFKWGHQIKNRHAFWAWARKNPGERKRIEERQKNMNVQTEMLETEAQHDPEPLPVEARVWNSYPTLPKVMCVSPGRMKHLKQRRKEPFFVKHHAEAIERISKSAFCMGDSQSGWKATFDWLLRPDTVAKVMEGKYERKTKPSMEQIRLTQQLIDEHNANPESVNYVRDCTPDQRVELKKLRARLEEMKRRAAGL
jgi:hypothetical protein